MNDCYDFWKDEIKSHLYDERRPYLEDYPGEYFYRASAWRLAGGERVVVLEQHH